MTRYWPFLYAANEELDYRTVVAPDFPVQAKRVSLLRRSLDSRIDRRSEGQIRSARLDADGMGQVSIFYRPVFVKDGKDEVCDRHGRPIVRIDGVLIRDPCDGTEVGQDEIETLIDQARAKLDRQFREFWTATNGRSPVPSRLQWSDESQPTEPKQPGQDPERTFDRVWWRAFAAGALAIVAVQILALVTVLSIRDPDVVTLHSLQEGIDQIREIVEEIRDKDG